MAPSWVPPTERVVGPGRLELPTSRLSGVRSNHLSYGPQASAWTDTCRLRAVSKISHLDKLEIGVNSRLAGYTDGRMTQPMAEPEEPGQTDNVRVCVKKEKRRRRSSASLAALTKQPVFYESPIQASL